MGELRLDLFSPKKWQDLQNLSDPSVTNYFKALGLIWAYQNMMRIAERGMASHKEVKLAPVMMEYVMEHLKSEYRRHIDTTRMRIFSEETAGDLNDLRRWQASRGPSIRRTAKNYERRLATWKSIYDNTPVKVKKRVGKVHRYVTLQPPVNADGSRVTYDQVIEERMAGFGGGHILVPFWLVLNYGTNGVTPGRPGYPFSKPINFVEKGEAQRTRFIKAAVNLYERFALEVLSNEKQGGSLADAVAWTRERRKPIRVDYFNAYDAALAVASS